MLTHWCYVFLALTHRYDLLNHFENVIWSAKIFSQSLITIKTLNNAYRQVSNIRGTLVGNCWLLRCSWSIACRCCSNHIFILHLILGFNILCKDKCMPRRNVWVLEFGASYIRDFTVYNFQVSTVPADACDCLVLGHLQPQWCPKFWDYVLWSSK